MGRITPREVRDRLDLNERQQAILVGTLLGDGCLAKHGNYHRLHIKHKLAQVTLAELKREAFSDFVTMPLHRFDQKLQGRAYPCVQFATRTSPIFTEWHRRFYLGRRKIVPEDIATCLLGEMFGLRVSSRSNKGKRILYVAASSLERFEALVGPHLLPDLSYKLVPRRFRNPVETTRWPQVDRPG